MRLSWIVGIIVFGGAALALFSARLKRRRAGRQVQGALSEEEARRLMARHSHADNALVEEDVRRLMTDRTH